MKHRDLYLVLVFCLMAVGCSKRDGGSGSVNVAAPSAASEQSSAPMQEPTAEKEEAVQTDGDFEIEIADGTVTIIGYTGSSKDVEIPSAINGLPVTAIGEMAFYGNSLTSVSIPDSVTAIEVNAFDGPKLTRVSIGNKVRLTDWHSASFGGLGFEYYYEHNDERAGTYVLQDGVWLSDGMFAQTLGDFKAIVAGDKVTIYGYSGSSKNVVVPPTINGLPVTAINRFAFRGNQLITVSIPNSVTSIHTGAFAKNQLTSVNIPDSVTSIGNSAFADNQLTNVNIPDSVISIDGYAFHSNLLTSVSIPGSVTSIGNSAFTSNQLTSVIIGNNVVLGVDSVGEYTPSFTSGFDDYYKSTGKQAGTYVLQDGEWGREE